MSGPMGRTAYGVKGITLEEGNEVIGMETITPDSTTAILTVTEGRLRQAHAGRRIPRPGPWRQGHHQRENHRAQRIGGRISPSHGTAMKSC